jgi:hypothetical protein
MKTVKIKDAEITNESYIGESARADRGENRRPGMLCRNRGGRVGLLSAVCHSIAASMLLLILSPYTYAQAAPKLAVINNAGEVWARDISAGAVGPGVKLIGPGLFGGSDEQFALADVNAIAIVTSSGALWSRQVTDTTIGSGVPFSGGLFGGSDAKYVLNDMNDCATIYVVTKTGAVWAHGVDLSPPFSSPQVGAGTLLNGPSLFGGSDDKYVVLDDTPRILVVNNAGEVWAHNLSASHPTETFCPAIDTVGAGYRLSGPGLFGAPNDKYIVIDRNNRLDVVNTRGEVWAHDLSGTSIGAGIKLSGPALFGIGSDDKYVVAYVFNPPPPPLP